MKPRRKDRMVSQEEAILILKNCDYGVLSMVTPENTAYSAQLNYVYSEEDNAVYMHCAKVGRKITCIEANKNVHFAVTEVSSVIGGFTTQYSSAVIEGEAEIVSDADEIRRALKILCLRLYAERANESAFLEELDAYIEKFLAKTAIIKISADNISGKANKGA